MTDATPPVPLLGRGVVRHRRLRPHAHGFAYDTFFVLLPMRQWRRAPGGALPRNRFGLVSFHDADHGHGGPDALALHDRIWDDGVRAILDAGGVMNDHHGVGLKLAPYMRAQHGAALDPLRRIKEVLDPNRIMNPGKLDL